MSDDLQQLVNDLAAWFQHTEHMHKIHAACRKDMGLETPPVTYRYIHGDLADRLHAARTNLDVAEQGSLLGD